MTAVDSSLTPERRIRELDGLRALAVGCVVVDHLIAMAPSLASDRVEKITNLLGLVGVYLFFVISGFIITRLQIGEFVRDRTVSLRNFYLRRFFRIIPVYWSYLAVAGILAAAGWIALPTADVVKSLLFVVNADRENMPWFLAHFWTLAVEEQYYLLFPFLIWVVLRGHLKITAYLLAALYVITTSAPVWTYWLHTYHFAFLEHFKCIIAGVLLALFYPKLVGTLRRIPLWFPVVLVGACAVIWWRLAPEMRPLIFLPSEAFILAFLVGWTVANPQSRGVSWLKWPVFQWLGALSYSIYIWQQLYTNPYPDRGLSFTPWVALVLTLLTASASYYLLERPLIALGKKLTPGVPPRPPLESSISP